MGRRGRERRGGGCRDGALMVEGKVAMDVCHCSTTVPSLPHHLGLDGPVLPHECQSYPIQSAPLPWRSPAESMRIKQLIIESK